MEDAQSSITLNRLELDRLKARINDHRLPVRLLAAAIDIAHLENIHHAPPHDQVKYYRRVRYFHAPLLHRLGYHAESQRLQDMAMDCLNHGSFVRIHRELADLSSFRPSISKDLDSFVNRFHFFNLTRDSATDSRMTDRTKGVYASFQKLTEPLDPETGKTGLDKYANEVSNLHDALSFRIVHAGDSVQDVEALRDHLLKRLPGEVLGGFKVSKVDLKRDWLRVPKNDTNYRAAHLIVHLEPEDGSVSSGKIPRKIEIQLVNQWMHRNNQKGFASHSVYKGDEPAPQPEEFVPPEGIHDFLNVEVHGPDGRERKFHPLEGEPVYQLLHALGRHVDVTPESVIRGHVAIYPENPDAKAASAMDLSQPVDPRVVYHVRKHETPVKLSNSTLIRLKHMEGLEDEWADAVRKELTQRGLKGLTVKEKSRKESSNVKQQKSKLPVRDIRMSPPNNSDKKR